MPGPCRLKNREEAIEEQCVNDMLARSAAATGNESRNECEKSSTSRFDVSLEMLYLTFLTPARGSAVR